MRESEKRECNVKLAFFLLMMRHRIDIICRCYSKIEICQIILGDLQKDFRESRENLLQKAFIMKLVG